MNLKVIQSFLLLMFLMVCINGVSQQTLTGEKALKKAEELAVAAYEKKETFQGERLHIISQTVDLLNQVQGYERRKIKVYYAVANFFHFAKLHQETIKTGLEAKRLHLYSKELLTPEEANIQRLDISYIYHLLGDAYEHLNQLDSAAHYYRKRIKINEFEKSIEHSTSLNNYGIFLDAKIKNKNAALNYYQKAYQITKENFPEHYLLASIRDNIADIYRELKKFQEANQLYEENFRYFSNFKNNSGAYEDVSRLVSAGAQYMATFFELGEISRGLRQFEDLEILLKGVPLPPEVRLEFLKAKETYFEKQNKLVEANHIGNQILKLSDSINDARIDHTTKTLEVMNTLTLNKVQLKNELDRKEKENTIKNQRLILWIVILMALIVAGSLLYLYKNRQQRNLNLQNEKLLSQKLLEITVLKNKQLESEIESKKRDLTDFAINLSQSMEWAEELKEKIAEKKLEITPEGKKLFTELEQEIDLKIKFDENNQEFLQRLDALSDSFYSQLKTLYPNLTKTELRLCSLIRLKLEPKQIANLQNISLPSLHTARYRLRKKMNLSESVNLDKVIQEL